MKKIGQQCQQKSTETKCQWMHKQHLEQCQQKSTETKCQWMHKQHLEQCQQKSTETKCQWMHKQHLEPDALQSPRAGQATPTSNPCHVASWSRWTQPWLRPISWLALTENDAAQNLQTSNSTQQTAAQKLFCLFHLHIISLCSLQFWTLKPQPSSQPRTCFKCFATAVRKIPQRCKSTGGAPSSMACNSASPCLRSNLSPLHSWLTWFNQPSASKQRPLNLAAFTLNKLLGIVELKAVHAGNEHGTVALVSFLGPQGTGGTKAGNEIQLLPRHNSKTQCLLTVKVQLASKNKQNASLGSDCSSHGTSGQWSSSKSHLC